MVSGGLVASVGDIPAQSPEFEYPDQLATLIWNSCRVAKNHPHADITLSSTQFAKLYALRSFRGSMSLSQLRKTRHHYKKI